MPRLPFLDGPFQHFKSAIGGAWRDRVAADLCIKGGFGLDPCSYSSLLMSGVKTRRCSERFFLEGVWNGFLLEQGARRKRSLSVLLW